MSAAPTAKPSRKLMKDSACQSQVILSKLSGMSRGISRFEHTLPPRGSCLSLGIPLEEAYCPMRGKKKLSFFAVGHPCAPSPTSSRAYSRIGTREFAKSCGHDS